jgi:hypothetical protein
VLGNDGKGAFLEAKEGCVFGGLGVWVLCVYEFHRFGFWMLGVVCIYFHGHVALWLFIFCAYI